MFIVSLNTIQSWLNWLISCCKCSVCVMGVVSSANSISLMRIMCTLVFVHRSTKLNSLLLLLVYKYVPSLDCLNAKLNIMEKMPNKVNTKAHPYFILLWIGKFHHHSWLHPICSCERKWWCTTTVGEQPIFLNNWNRPLLLPFRWMKSMYLLLMTFLFHSKSWCREKIMTIVDLLVPNSHWDSE